MPILAIEAKTYKELREEKDRLLLYGNNGRLVSYCNSSHVIQTKNNTFKIIICFEDSSGHSQEKRDIRRKIFHNRSRKRSLGKQGEGWFKSDYYIDLYDENLIKKKKERREIGIIKCPKCRRRKVRINIHATNIICPKCEFLFNFPPHIPQISGMGMGTS